MDKSRRIDRESYELESTEEFGVGSQPLLTEAGHDPFQTRTQRATIREQVLVVTRRLDDWRRVASSSSLALFFDPLKRPPPLYSDIHWRFLSYHGVVALHSFPVREPRELISFYLIGRRPSLARVSSGRLFSFFSDSAFCVHGANKMVKCTIHLSRFSNYISRTIDVTSRDRFTLLRRNVTV